MSELNSNQIIKAGQDASANIIPITATERGYRVIFPYKPNASAIRGFHSIGMVFHEGVGGSYYWSIPANKLTQAVEFICYWFGEKAEAGRVPYGVEVEAK